MQPNERELEGPGASQLLKAQTAAHPGSTALEFGTTPCVGVCCEIVGGALSGTIVLKMIAGTIVLKMIAGTIVLRMFAESPTSQLS